MNARLRALPPVQRLLESADAGALTTAFGHAAVVAGVRSALEEARAMLRRDPTAEPPDAAALTEHLGAQLRAGARPVLRRVINATGVVLHTNLGRAPMAETAALAAADAARGYSNLEFDLATGRRGARTQGVEPLICEITGAEAALAVNNAAAAVLLALSALAGPRGGEGGGAMGGEVIVSRGELVEIGGGFRIPDVIVQGGARLVEVGSTNKTRLADYAEAITPATRMLLKVHQSNYRMVGFTGEATLEQLAGLARERGLVLMHDLGCGALIDLRRIGLAHEPTAAESLAAGADLVAFSGDKLMGGPQAGLLAGREAVIAPLRRHPLLRAVRLDKMALAALEATLRLYRDPERAMRDIPALAMLGQRTDALQVRAGRLAYRLTAQIGGAARVEPSEGFAGGGTLPARAIESRAVTLDPPGGAEGLAARLRQGAPPVVARIAEGRLVLDMLTVADAELEPLAEAVAAAWTA